MPDLYINIRKTSVLNCFFFYKIPFLICVCVFLIHKGHFVVEKLVFNAGIKAITKIFEYDIHRIALNGC